MNHISGLMINVFASSAVDHGLVPQSGQNTIKLVFDASLLRTQH
jgi:hypothetical protein